LSRRPFLFTTKSVKGDGDVLAEITSHLPISPVGAVPPGPPLVDRADPWADARCRDGQSGMLELFFSDQLEDIAQAKALCSDCPVAALCLDGAIERHEPAGVWGGQLFADGQVLAFKRKRGRPPKNAQTQLTA